MHIFPNGNVQSTVGGGASKYPKGYCGKRADDHCGCKGPCRYAGLLPGKKHLTFTGEPAMTRRLAAVCRLCILSILCASSLWARDRFLLGSQLYKNYSSGSAVPLLTTYTYNDSGCRVDMSAYNGADTSAARMSRTVYAYNADNTLAQEVLKSATGDTVSIVQHGYDANKREIAVSTLTKALAVRFVDSSAYNANGRLANKKRYAGGSLSFYHAYTYNTGGKMTADTLYEKQGGTFVPMQAVVFSSNDNGTVASEKNWRFQSGAWYLISTNKMVYNASGTLASVTQYEGDGATNRMQDSTAYAYDANKNRTKKSDYDQDRTLLATTDYYWIDTQPNSILRNTIAGRGPMVRYAGGRIFVSDHHGGVQVSVYTAAGRMVQRLQHEAEGSFEADLAHGLGRGSYVAVVRSGNDLSTIHLTLVN